MVLEYVIHFLIAFEKNVSFVHCFVGIALSLIKSCVLLKWVIGTPTSISKILFCHSNSIICLLNDGLQNSLLVLYCKQASSDICRPSAFIVLLLWQNLTDFFKSACVPITPFRRACGIFIRDK